MKLTDRTIAALLPPTSGQTLHTDDTLPGFAVRVSQGGSKTFVLTIGTQRHRVTIGRYPAVSLAQARNKAKTLLAERQLGIAKTLTPHLEDVQEKYLASRDGTVRASSRKRDDYAFRHFKGLGRVRLGDIDPEHMQDILDGISAPFTRHEALIRFIGLVRFAQKKGYITSWPLHRLHAPISNVPRDRVLTDDELRQILSLSRIWSSAGHPYGTIVELLILTGQRRQQIGSLERSHVDFDEGTITWPAALMKTGRKHTIPVGGSVRAILEPRRTNGLYFPSKSGIPFSGWGPAVGRFVRDLGFDGWVLHDLRRTMATRWQDMGIEIATTEKMLSHSAVTGGLVGVYQRSTYLTQMRAAVQKWDDYLQALLPTTEGKYVAA